MGLIPSAATVYAEAYLTELGRKYLFDSQSTPRFTTLPNGVTVDRLKIERFSMGDPDVNYQIPSGLTSGQILDLSGDSDQTIKGAKGRFLNNLISPGASNIPSDDISLVEYKSTNKNIIIDLKNALINLPTVINQQLMTFIDGKLTNDGVYIVNPTNYGSNELQNNQLIIVLQAPTTVAPGYRLRIFFPTTGSNYNLMTFQFEKTDPIVSGTVTQTVSQVVTSGPAPTIGNTAGITGGATAGGLTAGGTVTPSTPAGPGAGGGASAFTGG